MPVVLYFTEVHWKKDELSFVIEHILIYEWRDQIVRKSLFSFLKIFRGHFSVQVIHTKKTKSWYGAELESLEEHAVVRAEFMSRDYDENQKLLFVWAQIK